MTATLPDEVQGVFHRFVTTEFTTLDTRGQPITWPVIPFCRPGEATIDVTTGLGYPKKARDARANPQVALLFSDPTGSGLDDPPAVLVQGTADVDDRDLDDNRRRYERESLEKLPATKSMMPPQPLRRLFSWYFTRIYVHVRPERVFVWPRGDMEAEPQLLGARLEEVRSGHPEELEHGHADPEGGSTAWDERIEEMGERYRTAVLSVVSPDGFPFSVRVPIRPDRAGGLIRIERTAVGAPLAPGRACLAAHDHAPDFSWQRNFQVRGDLVRDERGWALVPHKLIGGFELPPTSALARYRLNAAKAWRFRKTAKRELAKRSGPR
jgi:hypothetical protein